MIRFSRRKAQTTACLCFAMLFVVACNRSRNKESPKPDNDLTRARPVEHVDNVPSIPATPVNLLTRAGKAKQAAHSKAIDPTHDGWDTEKISSVIQETLTDLLTRTVNRSATSESIRVQSHDFSTTSLRPEKPKQAKLAGGVTVRTGIPDKTTMRWNVAAGQLFAPFADGVADVHVKIVRVERDHDSPGNLTTRCLIEIAAASEHRTVEQHLEWKCRWTDGTSVSPKLLSISAERFQETQSQGRWFVDRTLDIVGDEPCYRDQLHYGLNHWLSRIEVTHGMYVFAEFGLAIADVNNDGLEDVYVCQPGGLPNRLLIHQPDGTVRDMSHSAGVNWLDHTSSALFVDFDNDGDQDLAVALESRRVLLMSNDGNGRYLLAQELTIEDRHVQGLCAADFNNDSMVDLYLTVGFADERARPHETRPKFSYHDANEGGANVLFQNNIVGQSWQFRDVTQAVGLDQNNRRHSLAASWEDFDNDGDQDLYVANDYGQNCLYRNDDGKFTDIATSTGVVDFGSGMSVSWADYDRDGWMDLYVGNMFSSAGNRITRQNEFRPADDQDTRAILARFAKGNTLFRNHQGRAFEEPPTATDVQLGRWAWSSPFVDLNNDGWADTVVANGYVTGNDERDL